MDFKWIIESYVGWTIKKRNSHLELRKKFPRGDIFILVSSGDGYDYKNYMSEPDRWGRSTKGINLHMSTNGPIQMTFEEMKELQGVINNAEEYFKMVAFGDYLDKGPENA